METTVIQSNGHSQIEDDVIAFSRPVEGAPRGDPYAAGKRRVAICGFAPSSLTIATQTVFPDPTWKMDNRDMPSEIWGLNELYKVQGVTRGDRWFDMHDRRDGDISLRDPGNIEFLKSATMPIYMQEHWDDIPRSVRYPIDAVTHHFRTNYFTNSISFMIALAVIEGRDERGFVVDPDLAFGEIRVYGVDMAQDAAAYSEYREQRPSCEYFLGWARGAGIKVHVPAESDMLRTAFVYGYETSRSVGLKAKFNARRADLQKQIENLQGQAQSFIQQAQQLQFKAAGLNGALENVNYMDRAFMLTPEPYGLNAEGKLVTFDKLPVKEEPKKEVPA